MIVFNNFDSNCEDETVLNSVYGGAHPLSIPIKMQNVKTIRAVDVFILKKLFKIKIVVNF